MGLFEELGLGFVINYEIKGDKDIARTARELKGLQDQSEETADQAEQDAKKMAEAYSNAARQAAQGIALIGAGMATLATLGIPAILASRSEDRMDAVRSLLTGTGMAADEASRQIRGMHQAILDMARQTRVPLAGLEDAAYNLVSANLKVHEAQAALLPTAHLAVAGLGSMADATMVMTALLNTYGKAWGESIDPVAKADRIANTVAGTVAALNTKLPLLAEAFKFVAGDANVLKISLEETAITLGMLQTQGLQGGRAGTSMMAFLRELLGMGRKADDLLGPLKGLQLEAPGGGLRSLPDLLRDIEARTRGMSQVQLGTLFGSAFGEEGSRAAKLLLGQADALEEMIERVSRGNVLMAMVEDRQRGANAQYEIAKNNLHAVAVELGDQLLPLLTPLIQAFVQLVEIVRQFVAAHPQLTRMVLLLTVLGGTALIIAGSVKIASAAWGLYQFVLATTTGANLLAAMSFQGLAVAVAKALWPILLVMAALAGIIKLIDVLAGTDIFGSIADFISGKDLTDRIGAPVQLAGVPIQLASPPPIVQREPGREAGGSGQYIDQRYQTVKLQTSVTTQGTEPRKIAEQVAEHEKRVLDAGTEGRF